MSFKFSKTSLTRREGVDPKLIEIDNLAITLTVVDFGHPKDAGLRTDERQMQLFREGSSLSDGVRNRSDHQAAEDGYSKAIDYYAFVDGRASWDHEHMAMVACVYFKAAGILGYCIDWGGFWKWRDMPHIFLID